ncbi:MAG: M20/M25/M40 family metallo-hydrolase, partial [bacterium]|nr:M20/M25/M40 family metallo-hydrolase [bacterium]
WQMDLTDPAIEAAVTAYHQAFEAKPDLGYWTFSTNGVATAGIHGIPTVGFGPGEEKWAHAPNERVAVEDLVRATAFYMSFAREFAQGT